MSKDRIDEMIAAAAELRTLLPEAHAAIRDMRALQRELQSTIKTQASDMIDAAVTDEIGKLGAVTSSTISRAQEAIEARFGRLEKLIFGGTSKRPSLEMLAELRRHWA